MLKRIVITYILGLLANAVTADVRDPTQPGNLPQASATPLLLEETPLTVSEIWISDASRHALINGMTVKPGQKLDTDTQVLKIQPRFVVIQQHGVSKKLYLVPSVKSR